VYKTTFANYQKSKNILVLKNFYNLMKPRVMSLVVFTAFVGLIISNKQIDFITSALTLFFVAFEFLLPVSSVYISDNGGAGFTTFFVCYGTKMLWLFFSLQHSCGVFALCLVSRCIFSYLNFSFVFLYSI